VKKNKSNAKKNKSNAMSAERAWARPAFGVSTRVYNFPASRGVPGNRVRWVKRLVREKERFAGEKGAREGPDPSVGGLWSLTQDYVSFCRVLVNGRGSLGRFKV
jgi:hypothetical protein